MRRSVEASADGRARSRTLGALVGVAASVLMCGLAVVTVVLVPTWWPHPVVAVVAGLLLLATGFALVPVCFIFLGAWQFGAAALAQCLLAVGLLAFLDQAVLDVWGEPVETVVTEAVRHERNAPTGNVTGTWWECSLRGPDGAELERPLRESDFFPVGDACPAGAEPGDRLVVHAVPGGYAAPQTNPPVGGALPVAAFVVAATATTAACTASGMRRRTAATGSGTAPVT
ncbi:hypothetical protein [Streptomyces sp. KL118A]|uniref:hypothetical protein n=1 Tax=Streptomyces sp. KL118A TaxID=3045153 RepID=UPI00278C7F13|nr:hypothetical protein [Streptomyces sp. KL118A]